MKWCVLIKENLWCINKLDVLLFWKGFWVGWFLYLYWFLYWFFCWNLWIFGRKIRKVLMWLCLILFMLWLIWCRWIRFFWIYFGIIFWCLILMVVWMLCFGWFLFWFLLDWCCRILVFGWVVRCVFCGKVLKINLFWKKLKGKRG